jgi:DNA-binding winged helix-turn-helix (wHTH) protein
LIFLRIGAPFLTKNVRSRASRWRFGEAVMRLTFDDYVLDIARRELRRGSEPIALEPQVFDLLVYLVQNRDRVVSKNDLMEVIWDGRIVSDSAIANRINGVRRAVGDSGEAQRVIRTIPRKGFRFIGPIEEFVDEPTQPPVTPHPPRPRGIAPALFIAAGSALLGAALAAFFLWPTAAPRWPLAARPESRRAPITAAAGDLRLMSRLPLPALSNGTDQLRPLVSLTDMATELPRGQSLNTRVPVHLNKATADAQIEPSGQEVKQRLAENVAITASPAPNVTVSTPQARIEPRYALDARKSFERNSYTGRYRVEEDKFPEVPCTATRIASSTGGKCLLGYRALACDKAIDVVIYSVGSLSIEASTLIFDPYKITATGLPGKWCSVAGEPAYNLQDFQDMNQVTRRGTNWHNFLSNREDKSIEFSDGAHNCVAVHEPGPKWQGGYVYLLNASICRTDATVVRTEDVAYALNLLQVRQDDPVANLQTAGK